VSKVRRHEAIDPCISNVLFMRKKEGRRVEERAQELRTVLETLNMASGDAGQMERIRGGEVRQGIALEVRPEDLDGVELGGIGRQQGDGPAPVMQVLRDDVGSVTRQPVPDEDKGAAQMARERPEERDQPRGGDVLVGAQREVQPRAMAAGRQGQGGDDGHLVARPAPLIEDRGLATRRPTASHDRGQQQAALVDEHQRGVQAPRFFLRRGQSTFTHRWIAVSSRSRARRSGFCGLQPRVRSTRPI